MRVPVIAGNWKMNKGPKEAAALINELKPLVKDAEATVVVCVPAVDLHAAKQALRGSKIKLGAQNVHYKESGAYTGELSAGMLREAGAEYVIIGHSERRQYFGETDESVLKKTVAALEVGLTPIVCVGELLADREAGKTAAVLTGQFQNGIAGLTPEQFAKIVVAYEPVWAIGTGKTATPEIAADAHRTLREAAVKAFGADAAGKLRILYGGSVKPDNTKSLMAQPEIDGVLVGGASLKADSFASIVNF